MTFILISPVQQSKLSSVAMGLKSIQEISYLNYPPNLLPDVPREVRGAAAVRAVPAVPVGEAYGQGGRVRRRPVRQVPLRRHRGAYR